jgi:hypothetical protein
MARFMLFLGDFRQRVYCVRQLLEKGTGGVAACTLFKKSPTLLDDQLEHMLRYLRGDESSRILRWTGHIQ